MKVAFYSNFLNDHQIPFCDEMVKLIGIDFCFVATEPMSDERLQLGFKNANDSYPYVVKTYEDNDSYQKAIKNGIDSDVVIIGSAPDIFIKERLKQNKITFRYCERYFKRGKWRILDPRVMLSRWRQDIRYRNNNLYMLCASAYTAPDCRFIFSYPHKMYKWGYFPEVKKLDVDKLMETRSTKFISILWVGRLIKWKHPEISILVAEKLKNNGYKFNLKIIGSGELDDKLRQMIKDKSLNNCVEMIGSIPPEQIREQMERSNIFLFTSDRQEGWGAVLNESMSSGCAVVANKAIGSVPFLIRDGENGFMYDMHKKDDLYNKIEILVKNKSLREKMSKNACMTMQNIWCAEIAAERLIKLFEGVLNGKPPEFDSGPCSKAE